MQTNLLNNRLSICLMLFAGLFGAVACSEDEKGPLESSSIVPQQVKVTEIERLPGAVKLTYELPSDPSLFYVKGECIIDGQLRETKASAYRNNMTIEGFPDSADYTVNIYSVTRSEVASEPVKQQVRPLEPAFLTAFNTLNLFPDFGGATLSFRNPGKADLVIMMLYQDSDGTWINSETAYTSQAEGNISMTDMDPIPTWFGITIRDRWGHTTDTLKQLLTPIFEEFCDKSLFRLLPLPGDAGFGWGLSHANMWDDITTGGSIYVSDAVKPLPKWFTIDLGATYILSRFRYWAREDYDNFYSREAPLKMELWGSANPNIDGSWDDSWTWLTTTKVTKPSGLPGVEMNAEDLELGRSGFPFKFPVGSPPVRYIRIKVLETGNNGAELTFAEVSFWGAKVEQ